MIICIFTAVTWIAIKISAKVNERKNGNLFSKVYNNVYAIRAAGTINNLLYSPSLILFEENEKTPLCRMEEEVEFSWRGKCYTELSCHMRGVNGKLKPASFEQMDRSRFSETDTLAIRHGSLFNEIITPLHGEHCIKLDTSTFCAISWNNELKIDLYVLITHGWFKGSYW